jgi:hypothetical protein
LPEAQSFVRLLSKFDINYTELHSKDNEAARRRLRRRITYTLRKPTTMSTKLAEECGLVLSKKGGNPHDV